MNLDQLIRDADPAAHISFPECDSPAAQLSFERMLAHHPKRQQARQRRFVVSLAFIAAATATAVAITLGMTVTPGAPVSPAAAAVLNQAATAAGRQKPLVLSPGEYLYTETRSLFNSSFAVGGRKFFVAEYVYTDQSWLTQQGAGKDIWTVDSPVTFTRGTRSIWIAAGRPRVHNRSPLVSWYKAPKPGSGPMQRGDTGIPLDNLSHLPTTPAALALAIQHQQTGLADINADVEGPATPAGTFFAAMLILADESVGGSPALRSALFKVMAEQPGIKLLGRTHTRSRRAGIGLTTSPDREGTVDKVIIDPASGQILEADTYAHGIAEQWTEYLSTAVVKRIGQLPRG